MNPSPSFLRFASICCFLSVITTIGIHAGFPEPPQDFEKRILLYRDTVYLLNRWWVILHCLLVIGSMWGMALVLVKRSAGPAGMGFLFFAVFAIAEITRQMFVLFYFNGLREQYFLAEPLTREVLKNTLTTAGLLTAPLFGVFILSFGLGNLCYGWSLFSRKGFDKVISVLLLVWATGSLMALGNQFWKVPGIDSFLKIYNITYQPALRLLLGIWLWKKASLSLRERF